MASYLFVKASIPRAGLGPRWYTKTHYRSLPTIGSNSRLRYQPSSTFRVTPAPAIRISYVLGGLLVFGIGATVWGLYDFYRAFTMWPEEVRADLRAGIKFKHQGDLVLSQRYLRRAYETAKSLPVDSFALEPHLKTTGIAITLAEVLEAQGAPREAYEVYADALAYVKSQDSQSRSSPSSTLFDAALVKSGIVTEREGDAEGKETKEQANSRPPLSGPERVRAIALAHRLGAMAEAYAQPVEEQKKWLTYAVEEALRVMADELVKRKGTNSDSDTFDTTRGGNDELVLPEWVTKTDIGAPIEALGAFYAREGNIDYAFRLYQFALQLLFHDDPPPAEHQCRGALIINNLVELVVKSPSPDEDGEEQGRGENLLHAEKLARHAEELASNVLASGDAPSLCAQVLPVILFNLGMIYEMQGRKKLAKDNYSTAYARSKEAGLKEGVLEAQAAIRRMEREERTPKNR